MASAHAPDEPLSTQWADRLSAARGTAAAAGGLVHVEVDGSGEVVDLVLDAKAMRLPSTDLAAAIREAISEARTRARAQLETAPPIAPPLDLVEMQRTLTGISDDARRRLDEFAELAQQLTARLDRM